MRQNHCVSYLKTLCSFIESLFERKQELIQYNFQSEVGQAHEQLLMFSKLLRITQTDQLLHQYDLMNLQEFSNQGATLIIKLFTDVPVSKKRPGKYEQTSICMLHC